MADDKTSAVSSLSMASHVAKSINSRIYARLLLFRLELVPALESGSTSIQDGTLFYKLKADPELMAQEVAVFRRDGELLAGNAASMRRLPTEVHKALDMSDGLGFYLRPSLDKAQPDRYQLFYPLAGAGASATGDWSWVLYMEMDMHQALPAILDKLRLLSSENVLLYAGPDQLAVSFRAEGIDFSASRSFRNKRSAVHEITLTDLLRSDDRGEERLTFLKQSPPQMVDSIVSWDKNSLILGDPWIVVHSAKAYRSEGTGAQLNGEWESLGSGADQPRILMAVLTQSSNFQMVLELPDEVFLSEGRVLKNTLTAHKVNAHDPEVEVLSLSGRYDQQADQMTLRLVMKDEEKVKVLKYRFARSEKSIYKGDRKNYPHIKLRAFN